jgi:hypothetical protein
MIDEAFRKVKKEVLDEHKKTPIEPPKPAVKYYWHNDSKGDPSLKIRIPVPDDATLEKIYAARQVLSEIGIHFDTGMSLADSGFDWEFDFSLMGEHFVKDEMTGEYKRIERGDVKK